MVGSIIHTTASTAIPSSGLPTIFCAHRCLSQHGLTSRLDWVELCCGIVTIVTTFQEILNEAPSARRDGGREKKSRLRQGERRMRGWSRVERERERERERMHVLIRFTGTKVPPSYRDCHNHQSLITAAIIPPHQCELPGLSPRVALNTKSALVILFELTTLDWSAAAAACLLFISRNIPQQLIQPRNPLHNSR